MYLQHVLMWCLCEQTTVLCAITGEYCMHLLHAAGVSYRPSKHNAISPQRMPSWSPKGTPHFGFQPPPHSRAGNCSLSCRRAFKGTVPFPFNVIISAGLSLIQQICSLSKVMRNLTAHHLLFTKQTICLGQRLHRKKAYKM